MTSGGPEIALGGAVVGLAVGLTGMGGGALMAPLLVLVFGVDPLSAVSSDLLSSLLMKPVGAWVHWRGGTVDTGLARALCVGSVPAAFLSAAVVERLGPSVELSHALRIAMGLLLGAGCVGMAVRRLRAGEVRGPQSATTRVALRFWPTVAVGVVGGLAVGTTSVGAGSLVMALVVLLYPRLEDASLVGTDLAQAVPLVASAALGHAVFGAPRWGLTAWLVVGAVPATYLGARLSSCASSRWIGAILMLVLLGSALKLLSAPAGWIAGAVIVMGALITWRQGGRPDALAPGDGDA